MNFNLALEILSLDRVSGTTNIHIKTGSFIDSKDDRNTLQFNILGES